MKVTPPTYPQLVWHSSSSNFFHLTNSSLMSNLPFSLKGLKCEQLQTRNTPVGQKWLIKCPFGNDIFQQPPPPTQWKGIQANHYYYQRGSQAERNSNRTELKCFSADVNMNKINTVWNGSCKCSSLSRENKFCAKTIASMVLDLCFSFPAPLEHQDQMHNSATSYSPSHLHDFACVLLKQAREGGFFHSLQRLLHLQQLGWKRAGGNLKPGLSNPDLFWSQCCLYFSHPKLHCHTSSRQVSLKKTQCLLHTETVLLKKNPTTSQLSVLEQWTDASDIQKEPWLQLLFI